MSFELTTLGQFATIQGGYAYKSGDFQPSENWPVLKIKNVRAGRIDYSDASFVSDQIAEATSKWCTKVGDVLISMTGSGPSAPDSLVGRVGKVRRGDPPALINQRVGRLLLKDGQKIDLSFLYHLLSLDDTQQYLVANATGSANQVNISAKTIEAVPCPNVDFHTSKVISGFLDALDDRITLLRETNATLEAIAQALFKSWFVDFDPVRAKQEGRAPEGMDEATAALFPDSFEESELGLVPKGWRVSALGEITETVGGGTPDTKEPSYWEPGEHCWTTPKDLSGIQAPVLLNTERKLSAKGLAKVSSGLLPSGTLLMSSRAPIGYLAIAQCPMAINQGYIAMLPASQLPPLYLLFWCRQNLDSIKGRANGSTFMEISKKAFRPIPALLPPASVITAFLNLAEPLFDRLVENEKQAQTLATLRDTLLPRLISGQLRLPAASSVS